MKVHEYQAFELLGQYGVETPKGILVTNPDEAAQAFEKLGGSICILKAQVHTGGRGKAGGVKPAHTPQEAKSIAGEMLFSKLITKQTGPEGKIVRKLLVTTNVEVQKEYYLSFVIDGSNAQIMMLASQEGGTEIEVTAEKSPEKIIRQPIDITIGLKPYQARNVASQIGIRPELVSSFVSLSRGLYRFFIEKDCSLVEINPLVETFDGRLMAIDSKLDFDQNAIFRHKDISDLRDVDEEDPREVEASKFDLNYVALDGDIGCMVNGAGLAMATMDMIRKFGGSPANFLDVGGGATTEKVAGAFKILLSDSCVKGILINIFGGIMKCDIIAQGIVDAAQKTGVSIPVVVRLEGTNAELGKEILRKSGLQIIPANTMAQAAHTILSLTSKQEVPV